MQLQFWLLVSPTSTLSTVSTNIFQQYLTFSHKVPSYSQFDLAERRFCPDAHCGKCSIQYDLSSRCYHFIQRTFSNTPSVSFHTFTWVCD